MPKSASEASGTKSIGEPTMVWHIAQTLWTATSLAGAIFWAGAAAAFIFLTAVFRVGTAKRAPDLDSKLSLLFKGGKERPFPKFLVTVPAGAPS